MKKKGFSLVELSVVLVIIGLLIGGIMVGKSLVDSAKRTGVISDWQKYSAAANGYFAKYGYWPGDDAEALANATTSGKWAGTGNGNGDGYLGNSTATNLEYMYFWQHLSLSGFLGGSYSGGWGSVPLASINNSYITHYYDSTNPANQAFYLTGRIPSSGNSVGYSGETSTYTLTPKAALAIDTKIDDGLPSNTTGFVNIVGAGCASSGVYLTTSASNLCNLYYIYKK